MPHLLEASITSVSLLSNKFDAETAAMLLKVKEEHPKLKTLCGLTHQEKQLDYSNQGLLPADSMLLASELGVMTSLMQVAILENEPLLFLICFPFHPCLFTI